MPPARSACGVEAAGESGEIRTARSSLIGSIHEEIGVPDVPAPMDVKITATLGRQVKTTTVRVMPQRKWRIYVAASSHTDIGYTAVQPQCAERHSQNIDPAIDLIRQLPRLPLEPGSRLAGRELRRTRGAASGWPISTASPARARSASRPCTATC